MNLCATALLLLFFVTSCPAAELEPLQDLRPDDRTGLQEAARVLQEEIQLAARPQAYLLIDLVARAVHIKARGLDLHRLAIEQWSLTSYDGTAGIFRIVERPPVTRRKLDPAASADQKPISLADMPVAYTLVCTPFLSLEVLPPGEERPWLWVLSSGRLWWRKTVAWIRQWFTDPVSTGEPYLRLVVSAQDAQSLAWTVVDGMPLIIRRPPPS